MLFCLHSKSVLLIKVESIMTQIAIVLRKLVDKRNFSTIANNIKQVSSTSQFETVFSFPFVKYIGVLNRLKVYHIIGSSIAIPSSGVLEMINVFSDYTFAFTSYIGLTGCVVLSLASLPFKNTIGFLYISEDNKQIKISSVDFWGKRKDRIVSVDDWIPLLQMKAKTTDAIYLTPELVDGSKYKLFVKFGHVLNSNKIGNVLE